MDLAEFIMEVGSDLAGAIAKLRQAMPLGEATVTIHGNGPRLERKLVVS